MIDVSIYAWKYEMKLILICSAGQLTGAAHVVTHPAVANMWAPDDENLQVSQHLAKYNCGHTSLIILIEILAYCCGRCGLLTGGWAGTRAR